MPLPNRLRISCHFNQVNKFNFAAIYHFVHYSQLKIVNTNKMDFKSRFQGRKAFINKSGNIADSETKQVTVLKKPAQTKMPESDN